MMNKLFDLRFVIGLFFLIIGLMLLVYYLFFGFKDNPINLISGVSLMSFGIIMIILSYRK